MWQRKIIYKMAAVLSIIVALSTSIYCLQQQIDTKAQRSIENHLLLALPSGQYLKTAAFGFDLLIADLLWAHTVVDFGEHLLTDQDYTELYRRLDIITTLDSRFHEAYRFGSILLAMQAQQVDESILLLEKGLKNFPEDWQFHFTLGFIYTYYKDDTVKALSHFERAANQSGAPVYLSRLVGNLYEKTGKIDMALVFLTDAYNQFRDEKMREAIREKLKELLAKRDMMVLQEAIEKYKRLYGKYPETLEALRQTALIKKPAPDTPHDGNYNGVE